MDWRFNTLISCHELHDDGEVAARIYLSERRDAARPYRSKTLISAFYFGERRLNALARRNKEWVANRRDFADEGAREAYLTRRKAEVARFVRARKAEIG